MFSEPVTTFSPVLIRADRRVLKSGKRKAEEAAAQESERDVPSKEQPQGGSKK